MCTEPSPVVDEHIHCLSCDYNLTGLTGNFCPECGIKIDWKGLYSSPEKSRPGTAVYRAKNGFPVGETFSTVLQVLFAPRRFANCLRLDEGLAAPSLVAILSCACFVFFTFLFARRGSYDGAFVIYALPHVLVVMLTQSFVFAALGPNTPSHPIAWRRRFRFWWIVSCYTTIFVAAWPLTGVPSFRGWQGPAYLWPIGYLIAPTRSPRLESLGASLIIYWWWIILGSVLFQRLQERKIAIRGLLFLIFHTFLAANYMGIIGALAQIF